VSSQEPVIGSRRRSKFKNDWSYTYTPPYTCILSRNLQSRDVELTEVELGSLTLLMSCRVLQTDRPMLCGTHIYDVWQCVMLMVCYCIMLSDRDAIQF
jgi:hypothetical protein